MKWKIAWHLEAILFCLTQLIPSIHKRRIHFETLACWFFRMYLGGTRSVSKWPSKKSYVLAFCPTRLFSKQSGPPRGSFQQNRPKSTLKNQGPCFCCPLHNPMDLADFDEMFISNHVQPPSFLAPDANHCTAFTALAISPALSGGADGAIAAALVARAFFFLAMAVRHNLCRKTENCDALLPLLKKQSADTLQHVHILDFIGSVYSINLKSVQLAGNLKIDHWENLPLLIKSYQNHIFSGVKLSWFHQSCSSCRALLPVGACCDSRCPVASLVFRVFYCWEPNGYLSSLIWLQNGKFVKNQRFRQSERNTCLEESVWNLPPSNPT